LDHDQSVYVSYLAVGTILSLVGLWLFRKRNANAS
jgi:LPXTG-motif cell wall-anchored protein